MTVLPGASTTVAKGKWDGVKWTSKHHDGGYTGTSACQRGNFGSLLPISDSHSEDSASS